MARSVHVASIEGRSGKSLAALGLMELASRRTEQVGFFRPVIRDGGHPDPDIELMRSLYGTAQEPTELHAFTYAEARRLTEEGRGAEANAPDELSSGGLLLVMPSTATPPSLDLRSGR